MKNFINPDHPSIQGLVDEVSEMSEEIGWNTIPQLSLELVNDKISYGREKCIDLELEKKKPISLKRDYEVAETGEGICVDQSFLLASILKNLVDEEKVQLVEVGDEDSYEMYLNSLGNLGELENPYNHVCVGILEDDDWTLLDPVNGDINRNYKCERAIPEESINMRFRNQRESGIIANMKHGFLRLFNDQKNGIFMDYSATLDNSNLFRLYRSGDYGLLETWDLNEKTPEKIEEKFVEIRDYDIKPIGRNSVNKRMRKNLLSQVQDREFIDKVKKRVGNYYNGSSSMMYS